MRRVLVSLVLLTALPAVAAQEAKPRDQVSFQVEATREVPNDWVAATLGVEEESSDAAGLAARVNQRMAEALALAKSDARLQVSSGAYQTQPVYDKSRIVRWRASQSLVIETGEAAVLGEMAGKLQAQGLLLGGVAFSVSPETRKRVEDELIVEALSLFRERAGLIARGLGRRGWNLVSLALGQSGLPHPYEMRMDVVQGKMASMAEAPAPAFEAGRSRLRIDVNGTVEIE